MFVTHPRSSSASPADKWEELVVDFSHRLRTVRRDMFVAGGSFQSTLIVANVTEQEIAPRPHGLVFDCYGPG